MSSVKRDCESFAVRRRLVRRPYAVVAELLIGLLAAIWSIWEARKIAVARASLHVDSAMSLGWSAGSASPSNRGGVQDVGLFRGWLNDVSWAPGRVWAVGFDDFHPALHLLVVHALRVAGWSFQTSFLIVNLIGCLLLVAGLMVLNRMDRRPLVASVVGVVVVVVSPAVLRTASEPRHWMLATAFSMLSAVSLSWVLRSSLRGDLLGWGRVLLCAAPLVVGLLTESSLVIGFVAWFVVAFVVGLAGSTRSAMVRNTTRVFFVTVVLWFLAFPQGFTQYLRASPAFGTGDAPGQSASLDMMRSKTYLRLLGDLWQIGGDARVTFVLSWGSLLFLFGVQLGVVLVRFGVWSGWGWFDFRVVTHGFVVGLVGSVWAALYLLLYSFGFLPDHAAGWKYMLPHGVLLLVGVWDGVQRCPLRLVGGGLMVAVLVYHSMVLSLDQNGQAVLVERLADADRVVVFGNELDLLQVMYPLAAGEFVGVPEVYFAGWDEEFEPWMCGGPPEGEDLVVAARRPPWGLGVDGVFGDSANTQQSSPIGTLERLEVASIVSC